MYDSHIAHCTSWKIQSCLLNLWISPVFCDIKWTKTIVEFSLILLNSLIQITHQDKISNKKIPHYHFFRKLNQSWITNLQSLKYQKPKVSVFYFFLFAEKKDRILGLPLGLYRTSRPFQKSGEFSKPGLSWNQTFSFLSGGLLALLKIEQNSKFANFFLQFLNIS